MFGDGEEPPLIVKPNKLFRSNSEKVKGNASIERRGRNIEFTFSTFADLHMQINAFCFEILQKLGSEECEGLVFGDSVMMQIGWRIFWLKSLFD